MTTLNELAENIRARLEAEPGLAGAPCANALAPGFERAAAEALAAGRGAALAVSVPSGRFRRNAAGLAWLDAEVRVTAYRRDAAADDPGAPAAADLALLAAAALAGWTPPGCDAPLSAEGSLESSPAPGGATASAALRARLLAPRPGAAQP